MNKTITINVKTTLFSKRRRHTRKIRWWIGLHLIEFACWMMKTKAEVELEVKQ